MLPLIASAEERVPRPIGRDSVPTAFRPLSEMLLLGAVLLGIAARFMLASASTGTNDIVSWEGFASKIAANGVLYMYEHVEAYNHPPLIGYWAVAALRISHAMGVGFPVVFKTPMILADAATAYLVYRIWSARKGALGGLVACALYAWSVVAILVSAYHGNTDSLCAFLCLLSCYLASHRSFDFLAGLTLAAAINVKLIPLLIVLPMLAPYRSWRRALRFGTGLALGALPFVPILLRCPAAFYQKAVAYNSIWDNWGIPLFLLQSNQNSHLTEIARNAANWYVKVGRDIIILAIVAMCATAWVRRSLSRYAPRRSLNRYELVASAVALFLILTPGFGVQYTVYVVPLLFAADAAVGAAYSSFAGLYVGLVYLTYWDGHRPFFSEFRTPIPMPAPLVGLVAWIVLIRYVLRRGLLPTLAGAATWSSRMGRSIVARWAVRLDGASRAVSSDPPPLTNDELEPEPLGQRQSSSSFR